ncbi:Protoheme IX farnesyltransferase, mitochondrial [Malassezia pachydermatis]|uniref:Protoheme IX farnesyltransferase, mitochondrial n=1 Tax=Malassezia pachydermatis TaxID=77020 RepID=A0A0M9VPB2_9BASI|nr:protoheme ix farnesyltransferase [Malassezia pachydermatis]KOS14249.1 protoheme ix farnesyltransferase [Malassezia pachydermatis]
MEDMPPGPTFFSPSSQDPLLDQREVARRIAQKYRPATDDPMYVEVLPQEPAPSSVHGIPEGFVAQRSRSPTQWFRVYRQLSKSRLTFLVVLSGMMGYSLCPSSLAVATSLPPVVRLLALAGGITLCSTAANALNQIVEAPYDAQMARTKARPLPRRALTPAHACSVAAVSAVSGVSILYACTNTLTAALGAANIVLYSFMYTPMKRHSIVNTWLGAIVGAIPPLMGWASCTGTLTLPTDAVGWILAGILYAWQFPHFNALSHAMGNEYARGGYRMMAVTNPALNQRVAFRYALALIPLCSVALPLTGTVLAMPYAVLSLIPNLLFAYAAGRFWYRPSEKTARSCFWFSLFHLPAVMVLAMACKTDLWEHVWPSPPPTAHDPSNNSTVDM